jgi:hypothetical protein
MTPFVSTTASLSATGEGIFKYNDPYFVRTFLSGATLNAGASNSISNPTIDSSGNIYVGVVTNQSYLYILQYSSTGSVLLNKYRHVDIGFIPNINSLEIATSGNVYATGNRAYGQGYSGYILKLNSNLVKQSYYTDNVAAGQSKIMGIDGSENIYTINTAYTYPDNSGQIAKTTSAGSITSYKSNGPIQSGSVGSMDSSFNLYVTINGLVQKYSNAFTTTLWNSSTVNANAAYYLTPGTFWYGCTVDASGNSYQIGTYGDNQGLLLIQKLNSNGVQQWSKKITFNGNKTASAPTRDSQGAGGKSGICLDNNGNIYITGKVNDNTIANRNIGFLMSFDNSGNKRWSNYFNFTTTTYESSGLDLIADNAGGLIVTGIYGSQANNGEVFMMRVPSGGDLNNVQKTIGGQIFTYKSYTTTISNTSSDSNITTTLTNTANNTNAGTLSWTSQSPTTSAVDAPTSFGPILI